MSKKGGRVGREKCYNSDQLSGVRSLNYSEMWTACQCRGLSRSCGATPHTHDSFKLLEMAFYQSIYPSIYSLNLTLTQLPTRFLFSFLTLKSPFVTTKAWPSIHASYTNLLTCSEAENWMAHPNPKPATFFFTEKHSECISKDPPASKPGSYNDELLA